MCVIVFTFTVVYVSGRGWCCWWPDRSYIFRLLTNTDIWPDTSLARGQTLQCPVGQWVMLNISSCSEADSTGRNRNNTMQWEQWMVRWTDGYGDDIVRGSGAHFRLSSLILVLSPRHNTLDKTRAPVFIVNKPANDSPSRRWWWDGGCYQARSSDSEVWLVFRCN